MLKDPVTNHKVVCLSHHLYFTYIWLDRGDAGAQGINSSLFSFSSTRGSPLQLPPESVSQFHGGVDDNASSTPGTASQRLIGAREYAFSMHLLNAKAKRKSGAEQSVPPWARRY